MRSLLLLSVCFALVTSCSSNTQPSGTTATAASSGATGGESGEHHHGGGHHHNFSAPTVTAYHEVLRPLWHSDPGAARDERTCAQAATLVERAQAIGAAPVPTEAQARADAWRTAATTLTQRSEAVRTTCGATPRGDVAAALGAAHGAFHDLTNILGAH